MNRLKDKVVIVTRMLEFRQGKEIVETCERNFIGFFFSIGSMLS